MSEAEIASIFAIDAMLHVVVTAAPGEKLPRAVTSPIRPGWIKTRSGIGGKSNHYLHGSGWTVEHCGHSTAIYPYLAINHETQRTLATPSGRGFKTFNLAADAVEAELRRSTQLFPASLFEE